MLLKKNKKSQIDKKTDSLISQGFVFDNAIFSLSSEAQSNWLGMVIAKDMLTYPYSVTTKLDGEYAFQDSSQILQFFATGIGTVSYHVANGRSLKVQIDACTNIEDVESIKDER